MRNVNMEKRIANLLNSCKESNILEKESIQIKDLISDYFANEDVADGFSLKVTRTANRVIEQRKRRSRRQLTITDCTLK